MGSRIEPTTTSTGQHSDSPSARTTEVLPVPGLPHNNTGTPAATDMANACSVVDIPRSAPFTSPTPICPRPSDIATVA